MKFERHFQQSQDPEWVSDYIDYRTIKTLLKSVPARAHEQSPRHLGKTINEVLTLLNKGIEQVEKQYLAKFAFIKNKQRLIFERHSLHEKFLVQEAWPNVTHSSNLAAESLLELARDFDRLHRFAETNRNAAQRMMAKISASQSSERPNVDLVCRILQESKFANPVDSYSHPTTLRKAATDLLNNDVNNKPYKINFSKAEEEIFEQPCNVRNSISSFHHQVDIPKITASLVMLV